SIRRRLEDYLPAAQIERSGNVMIATMPFRKPQRHPDHRALRSWVRQGNTLVILAAINETPEWSRMTFADPIEDIFHLFNVDFDVVETEAEAEEEEQYKEQDKGEAQASDVRSWWEPFPLLMQPYAEHPLMHGVSELQGFSELYSNVWRPDFYFSDEFTLRLARLPEHSVDALWQLSYGDGRVILSSSASLLSNRMLGEADNARFFSNILTHYLASGGTVLFDDFHQGVSELYDPEAFFSDRRVHSSILFLVALWLFYLVGNSARLGPLREPRTRSHQAAFVTATGGLMARKLEPSEAGKAMIDHWMAEMHQSGRLAGRLGASPPWRALEEMPMIDAELLSSVRSSYTRLGRGEKVDLKKMHNDIQTLKGNMG
ncbi:MAG: DUF4350 domain-containing protein, partial [Halioglobus sp.]